MTAPRARIAERAARQDSVITTAQCLELGAERHWVARQVSSGRWQRLHRGVHVVHSGPQSWRSRARAALLYAGRGAALSHAAAAVLHGFTERAPRIIDVRVAPGRTVRPSAGVRIHRGVSDLDVRSRLAVVSRGEAAVDLIEAARTEDEVIAILCAVTRARVFPEEVMSVLTRRRRSRRRALATELLGVVEAGIESPLELRYQRDVERRHGLPRAQLQRRQVVEGVWIRADRIYAGMGVRAEMDGALAHPGGRTDEDTWRDNAVLIACGEITLRYRWKHVAVTPCEVAAQVVAALRSRGWRGSPRGCGLGCPVS